MTKVAIKNENITSFGGIYHIMDVFSKLGFEKLTESVLGKRGSSGKAFCYGSIFGSLFFSYLCGGECLEDINALIEQFKQSPSTLLPYAELTNTERLPRFTMNIKQARRTSTYKILTSEAHIRPFSFMIENIVFMMDTAEYKQNRAKLSIHNSKSKKRDDKILCNCFIKFK